VRFSALGGDEVIFNKQRIWPSLWHCVGNAFLTSCILEQIYINGAFVTPRGEELFDLFNPATGQVIGRVRLGGAEDIRIAVAAAERAFPAFSRTSKQERIAMLHRLHDRVLANAGRLADAQIEEFGAPASIAPGVAQWAASLYLGAAKALEDYPLTRQICSAEVVMEPLGVAGLLRRSRGR
jgi:aldehyde dehydrogenase (NAD+)